LYDRVWPHMASRIPILRPPQVPLPCQQRFHPHAPMPGNWVTSRPSGAIFRQTVSVAGCTTGFLAPNWKRCATSARTVPGVLGERMLGGGDKGTGRAGACRERRPQAAVDKEYPRRYPDLADKYRVHVCKMVDGVTVLPVFDIVTAASTHSDRHRSQRELSNPHSQ